MLTFLVGQFWDRNAVPDDSNGLFLLHWNLRDCCSNLHSAHTIVGNYTEHTSLNAQQ